MKGEGLCKRWGEENTAGFHLLSPSTLLSCESPEPASGTGLCAKKDLSIQEWCVGVGARP